MLVEDIYDVLALLVSHAARSGLPEHLLHAAREVVEKADPKVAQKRAAAEAAKAEADAQYQRFLAFQQMEQRAQDSAPPASAPVVSAPPAPAGPFAAPPVTS